MAQPLPPPSSSSPATLTPQFCFSTTALRDFLRISRSSVDDTITQHLNALVTPARAGFDPSSTSQRGARPLSRQVDARSCQTFKDNVLFPSWQARSHVLSYCALVATSPDPDDPETALREAENEKNRERVVNERLDPYSGRYFPREPRTQQLASLIRQERSVENIVRAKTWRIVRERCGETATTWEEALGTWRKPQDTA
ncbi:caffeine-induced death protein 2 [Podospora appendiculata]|uniref:Caffeine-induced death protein 2 n=1 Tax=Podospora appendiculata TaxID=314037 RepID=A0AAE0XAG1_9PEZI|nr:caffeine-induced death protein 2 [Podospora appendiculata]